MNEGPFSAALRLRKSLTPNKGYNLVGLDDFEMPGEGWYLIEHYDTREEALAAQKEQTGVKTFILPVDDDDPARETQSETQA